MKIVNDLSLTGLAALMGIVFLGEIHAIREGTLASAVLIGLFAKWIDHGLTRLFPKEAPPMQEEPREVPLEESGSPKEKHRKSEKPADSKVLPAFAFSKFA